MTLPYFCLATISGHRNQQVAWWGASLQAKILETTVYYEPAVSAVVEDIVAEAQAKAAA